MADEGMTGQVRCRAGAQAASLAGRRRSVVRQEGRVHSAAGGFTGKGEGPGRGHALGRGELHRILILGDDAASCIDQNGAITDLAPMQSAVVQIRGRVIAIQGVNGNS